MCAAPLCARDSRPADNKQHHANIAMHAYHGSIYIVQDHTCNTHAHVSTNAMWMREDNDTWRSQAAHRDAARSISPTHTKSHKIALSHTHGASCRVPVRVVCVHLAPRRIHCARNRKHLRKRELVASTGAIAGGPGDTTSTASDFGRAANVKGSVAPLLHSTPSSQWRRSVEPAPHLRLHPPPSARLADGGVRSATTSGATGQASGSGEGGEPFAAGARLPCGGKCTCAYAQAHVCFRRLRMQMDPADGASTSEEARRNYEGQQPSSLKAHRSQPTTPHRNATRAPSTPARRSTPLHVQRAMKLQQV